MNDSGLLTMQEIMTSFSDGQTVATENVQQKSWTMISREQ